METTASRKVHPAPTSPLESTVIKAALAGELDRLMPKPIRLALTAAASGESFGLVEIGVELAPETFMELELVRFLYFNFSPYGLFLITVFAAAPQYWTGLRQQ